MISCGQKSKNTVEEVNTAQNSKDENKDTIAKTTAPAKVLKKDKNFIISDEPGRQQIELKAPTVIIVQLDSAEIEKVKKIDGESRFYTATDDLMWYNAMLLDKLDSLKIAVKYTDKDTIDIKTPDSRYKLMKDTTFSIYTYFYFDGKEFSRKGLFELLGE